MNKGYAKRDKYEYYSFWIALDIASANNFYLKEIEGPDPVSDSKVPQFGAGFQVQESTQGKVNFPWVLLLL